MVKLVVLLLWELKVVKVLLRKVVKQVDSVVVDSAVEAVIERYGPEHHELAGRAKDMGSAAVFVTMLNVLLVWGLILVPRYL